MNQIAIAKEETSPPLGVLEREHRLAGTICGLLAAFGYALTNVCLRKLVHCDSVWVSCIKAVPNALVTLPFVMWHFTIGYGLVKRHTDLLVILATAIISQLGGNVLFQWSLGSIGLAMGVPITLSSVIIGSTSIGRFFLRETVNARTLASITIILASICVLSLGAEAAHRSVQQSIAATGNLSQSAAQGDVWLGVLAAVVAGFAYSTLGATIRWSTTRDTPMSTTLFVVGIVGVFGLGAVAVAKSGWQGMIETTTADRWYMAGAGILNAAAFFSLALAMRWTGLVYVNLLNGSQAAMAAVLGVVVFHEALTLPLAAGVVLAVLGLANLQRRKRNV